jgi:glycine cleavage system H lipoate-binding protein
MRCPFLREEQVKSCQAAPFRKALARSVAHAELERCSSAAYVSCAMLRQSHEEQPNPTRCPFLSESLSQFCAATTRPAYVPWSESPELRCAHDGHRFCETFLSVAGAGSHRLGGSPADAGESSVETVAGVPVPSWLYFSESHFWLDVGEDDVCHVGLDALIAQLLGEVERLVFVVVKGSARPSVVVTVRGVELTLTFPQPLLLVGANTRLRSSLAKLSADPYGRGWLFEARLPSSARCSPAPLEAATEGLRRGPQARDWMAAEVRRVSERVHATLAAPDGPRLVADGGRFATNLLEGRDTEQAWRLLVALFPSCITRRIR